jgi:DNA-binding XRE family transcriptional regulator
MLITSAQCRAARALVDMDQADLAKAAQVTRNVIINFEKGRSKPNRNNLSAIRRILEEAGVEFINGGSPGVRLKPG